MSLNKIKVAFFPHYPSNDFTSGGGALSIWQTLRAISELPEVELIVFVEGKDLAEDQLSIIEGLQILNIRNRSKRWVLNRLGAYEPNIIHAYRSSNNYIIEWARANSIRSVYEVRLPGFQNSYLWEGFKWPLHKGWRNLWMSRKERLTAQKADLVLVPSKSALKGLREHYEIPIEQSDFAYNGLNQSIFKPSISPYNISQPKIVAVGRMEADKNCKLILDIFCQLKNKIPKLTLDFVGDGNERIPLEKRIKEERVGGVTFHGFLPQEKLVDIYHQSTLLMALSTYESFGNVIVEAMLCGVPVIGYNVGSIPELIEHGKNGMLFELGEKNQVIQEVQALLTNQGQLNEMSTNAINLIPSKFSWSLRAKKVLTIYNSLCNG